MKAHLMHIKNTLERKALAEKAIDPNPSYTRYRQIVANAVKYGHNIPDITAEMQREFARITKDVKDGDSIFQAGVTNTKEACLASLQRIIEELKGSN